MSGKPRPPAHPLPVSNPGIGADDAPFNSAEWADSVRAHLHGHCYTLPKAAGNVASYVDMLRQTNGWEHLNKPDGSRFSSLEEFCEHRRPWGLGMKLADLEWWTRATGPASAPLYWNPANGETNSEKPEIHDAANLLPMLPESDLEHLAADIKANGLRHPIVIWVGKVIDGRNRLAACERAGVIPTFTTLAHCPDPVAFVLSANLHRRHLSESQRAMVAARALPLLSEQARARQVAAAEGTNVKLGRSETLSADLREASSKGKAAEQAADLVNVSPRTVEAAARVQRSGTPELVAAVDRGEVAVSAAAAVATLPPDEQREAVREGKVAERARDKRKKPAAKPAAPLSPAPSLTASVRNAKGESETLSPDLGEGFDADDGDLSPDLGEGPKGETLSPNLGEASSKGKEAPLVTRWSPHARASLAALFTHERARIARAMGIADDEVTEADVLWFFVRWECLTRGIEPDRGAEEGDAPASILPRDVTLADEASASSRGGAR